MDEPKVRDAMHAATHVCRPDTPWAEVVDAMAAHDVSALVVVDDAGLALGVVSRTDLLEATFVEPYLEAWYSLAARHLMSSPVISVRADSPLDEAARLLHERKVHRIVVTEPEGSGERPVGILSLADLVRHMPRAPHDRAEPIE
jgi:CBS domain-containing protein